MIWLQTLLDRFRADYNIHRPHRALDRRTPAAAYAARPKATPTSAPTGQPDTRLRRDHIDIGRTHTRTHVLLLVQDRHIRVINATTGQLLRQLTPGPHPRLRTPKPPHTRKRPNP
jgi:hypothetical protein